MAPLLVLDMDRRLVLHPLRGVNCKEDEASGEEEVVVSDQVCPLEKWVHVGCEVCPAPILFGYMAVLFVLMKGGL